MAATWAGGHAFLETGEQEEGTIPEGQEGDEDEPENDQGVFHG